MSQALQNQTVHFPAVISFDVAFNLGLPVEDEGNEIIYNSLVDFLIYDNTSTDTLVYQ